MRTIFSRLLLLVGFLSLMFIFAPSSAQASVVEISSCTDLQAIGDNATNTYLLINDVDCSTIDNFTPLNNFQGTLDGDGYAISDLTIAASNYTGLFSTTNGAIIQDVSLLNAQVYGNFVVGILAADMASSTVSNVYIQGSVNSSAALSLTGGLVGAASSSTFTYIRTNVSVFGYSYIGGMFGTLSNTSTVQSSFSEGTITAFGSGGVAYAGGLVGQINSSALVNTYSQATVTAYQGVIGGLVGSLEGYGGHIENSYARGEITNSYGNTGGLVGLVVGAASSSSSYWDTDTSLRSTSATGTAKTTSEMQTLATFTGWDFSTVWFAPSTGVYPLLRAFDITAPTAPGIPAAENPTRYTPYVTWTAATDAGVGLATVPYTVQWSTTINFTGTVYTSTTAGTAFRDVTDLADGTWYFRVRAKDKLGQTGAYSTSSAIIVDATIPVITRIGPDSVSVDQYTTYSDAGATALDAVQGDLTSIIVVTNPVNTEIAGVYTVSYIVTDAAGNVGEPVVRSVRVLPVNRGGGGMLVPVHPVALGLVSGGSVPALVMTVNGSSLPAIKTDSPIVQLGFNADPAKVKGYAVSLRPDFQGTSIYPYQPVVDFQLPMQAGTYTVYTKLYSVTGDASPVMSAMIEYGSSLVSSVEEKKTQATSGIPTVYQFKRNLRLGMEGEDVRELQKFLNARGFTVATRGNGSVGKESVYFGSSTARALARFQMKYRQQVLAPLSLTVGTGRFLEVTRAFVNAGKF